jgi:UDP-glucuronate decarboxylase
MNELAREVALAVGTEVKVRYLPLPQDDPKQRQPDISRAKRLLNWEPTVPLREGLKKTVAYFSNKIRNGNSK